MSESMTLLVDAAGRATLVLAAGWVVAAFLRRAAAATRHFAWMCTLVAAVLVPPAAIVTPDLAVHTPARLNALSSAMAARPTARSTDDVRRAAEPAPASSRDVADAALASTVAPSLDGSAVAVLIWALGAAAVFLYVLSGFVVVSRMRRSATTAVAPWVDEGRALAEAFDLTQPIAFLESSLTSMPIVCGLWRPAIVMPTSSGDWSDARRRVALLHELAHIRRRDCAMQMLVQIVCAVYWFNPLMWAAARRLRVERERACDDFVLAAGTRGSDYAGHLLEIARTTGPRLSLAAGAGLAMAHRSQLEGRLMAILDPAIRRNSGLASRFAVLMTMLVMSAPVAALQLQARDQARRPPTADLGLITAETGAAAAQVRAETARAAAIEAVERGVGERLAIATVPMLRPAAAQTTVQQRDWVHEATGNDQVAVYGGRGRAIDRALLESAEEGDLQGVGQLLGAGGDVNAVIRGDGTPLIAAARRGRLDVAQLLLDRGADPNLAVPGDGNPIIMAAQEGHHAMVALLLQRGADPNAGVPGDGSAIIMAAREGHLGIVELLLQHGANVHQIVDGDENALIQASAAGQLEMVKRLVALGADINARVWIEQRVVQREQEVFDNAGRRRVLPVRRLVAGEWRSALSVARARGYEAVVAYLLSVGAQE